MSNTPYSIILFYKFIKIEAPEALKVSQYELARKLGLTGRLIIGQEGINGTFEGLTESIKNYQRELKNDPRFSDIKFKISEGNGQAFNKLKVKVRPEIVTLGAGEFDPTVETAPTVNADELKAMYDNNEDFVVVDLRNDYEIKAGAFDKTFNPGLGRFKELPEKLADLAELKDKKIITVCTGGIRCEKATCLMKKRGFKNIYQLEDGIHTYMEKYPGQNFKGTLFVFDNRMVSDIVQIDNKTILGKCEYCQTPCEQYYSDDTVRPSRKVICCDKCYKMNKDKLRNAVELKFPIQALEN